MADALDKIRKGVEKARTKLAAQRLGGREFAVIFRTYTVVGGDPASGTPGTRQPFDVTLTPSPSVIFRPVFRMINGALQNAGEVTIGKLSRIAYTFTQLYDPDADWIINGETYCLSNGLLDVKPTEFVAVLKRRQRG